MKWFIASDIHGSAFWCRKMLDAFTKEKADRILLLGDILYHGPRNDLPDEYSPKKVIEMLNPLKDIVFAVRGNCDSEVDDMVLDFPILSDYTVICDGDTVIFATHGHIYNEDRLPPLKKGTVLLHGHTHVSAKIVHDDYVYMKPGSVSIPKGNTRHGYMTLENGVFEWKDLE